MRGEGCDHLGIYFGAGKFRDEGDPRRRTTSESCTNSNRGMTDPSSVTSLIIRRALGTRHKIWYQTSMSYSYLDTAEAKPFDLRMVENNNTAQNESGPSVPVPLQHLPTNAHLRTFEEDCISLRNAMAMISQ